MRQGGTRGDRGLFERLAILKIAFLVMAVVLVMAACGGDEEPKSTGSSGGGSTTAAGQEEGGTIEIDGQSANNHGEADVAGESKVDLEADDFYFEPTVITGEAGQTITIHVENAGDSTHNFSITDQDISEDLDPGSDTEVEVTFPDSGTLVYFCKFHQSQGMLGGLEVSS
jgi:plastocyanin